MGAVVALEGLLAARTIWQAGRSTAPAADGEPTGHPALDALLPQGGLAAARVERAGLLPADGVGELALLLPTLARLTAPAASWRSSPRPTCRMRRPGRPPASTRVVAGGGCRPARCVLGLRTMPAQRACSVGGWGGHARPMRRPCAGCRWPPTPATASASRCAMHAMPPIPRRRRCVCGRQVASGGSNGGSGKMPGGPAPARTFAAVVH